MKAFEIQRFVQKSIEYLLSLQCSLDIYKYFGDRLCRMQWFIWKVRGMWIVKVVMVTESYIFIHME